MLRLRRAPPATPEIPTFDMTPMIDVTFQLIIFFMLIMDMSSTTHQKLDQPSARYATVLLEADEVVVNVQADGKIKVFGKAVSDDGLETLLTAHRKSRSADFPVLIRADKSAPFERIQLIMTMTQHVGGVNRLRFGAKVEGKR